MHRSNFRQKGQVGSAGIVSLGGNASRPSVTSREVEDLQAQVESISKQLKPLKAALETLVASQRHDNQTIPSDLGRAVRSVLDRMEALERNQSKTTKDFSKMETTFSNALLKMSDKVEKIAGGEDSKFSLAHSIENLIDILSNRKYRVIRDNDGNMAALETDSGKKYS